MGKGESLEFRILGYDLESLDMLKVDLRVKLWRNPKKPIMGLHTKPVFGVAFDISIEMIY